MLLDQDFDIIKKSSEAIKFAGVRRVVFTSNIISVEYPDGVQQVAFANVIDDSDELMYRVAVVFPNNDIVNHHSTYYSSAYSLPVAYDKNGRRIVNKNSGIATGRRIKGHSFELTSTNTQTDESKFYNRKTGNHEVTKKYRIHVAAETLKKIEDIHVEKYRLVVYDTVVENTKHITEEVKNFNGQHRATFTTNVYASRIDNEVRLLAKAIIDGQEMVIGMGGIDMKVIEPSRWAPYYVYRPIVNGRGCTIKNHAFDIYVNETEVNYKNEWSEELNATVSTNKYILSINEIKKAKK